MKPAVRISPGVYSIPMSAYLADPAISSSGLKHLARSPAHYRYYVDNPQESTQAQIEGSCLHKLVFEPSEFKDFCYIRPGTYTNKAGEEKPWHAGANECKKWIKEHDDRPIISSATSETIALMRNAIVRHPAGKIALQAGKAEQSAFCVDPISKMPIKARFDFIAGNVIVDVKKCQDASPAGFARQVANYGYDLQAATHTAVAEVLDLGLEHFVFIAVESEPPFAVGVYELTSKSLASGQSKFRRLMSKYADCVEKYIWPAYSSDIQYLELPTYALNAEFNALLLEDQPNEPALAITQ